MFLDARSGRLDSRRLDTWTLDAWTQNAWILDDWKLGPRKFFPFLVTSIYLLLLYNIEFLHILNGPQLWSTVYGVLNVLQMVIIFRTLLQSIL